MRKPVPPFNLETAIEKVRLAEDGWNSRDPEKVSMAYSIDSFWRNRRMFISGRSEIVRFLESKWRQEHEYRLVKELFAFRDNRIAVRYAYEYHNDEGNWFRAYGNEIFDLNTEISIRAADSCVTGQQLHNVQVASLSADQSCFGSAHGMCRTGGSR